MTTSGHGKPDRSGKRHSQSPEWQRLCTLEDVMALLRDVEEERERIKRAAWVAVNDEIYQAAKRQKAALERLKARLSARWYELFGELGE